MLGFGAAGALLALSGRIQPRTAEKWFPRVAVLAAASLIVSPALVHQTPLDATQLAWNLGQWPRLALVYVLLALPFGIGALAIVLALNAEPQRPGKVYGASFVGSGLGTVAGVGILWLVNPVRALALPALLASVGAASAAHQPLRAATRRVVGWATVFVAALVLAYPLWRLDPTPYKGLPQVEAYPDARRVAEPTSPLGWIAAVEARAFRHAPGLSLAYRGEFPTQLALFVDGELAGAATAWPDDSSRFAVLDWLPSALPYALDSLERVLVVGAGGGIEVSNALAHRARSVTAVELLPDLVALTRTFPPGPTNDRNDPRISWVIADARAFTASTRETFDLVTLGPTAGLGTAAAGVHALNEDFLHTVQAYVGYLELLRGGGVLAITRWLTIPPRETVRVILTAAEALRRVVPEQVSTGLVVARSWGTATVLAKPSGFTPQEISTRCATGRGAGSSTSTGTPGSTSLHRAFICWTNLPCTRRRRPQFPERRRRRPSAVPTPSRSHQRATRDPTPITFSAPAQWEPSSNAGKAAGSRLRSGAISLSSPRSARVWCWPSCCC